MSVRYRIGFIAKNFGRLTDLLYSCMVAVAYGPQILSEKEFQAIHKTIWVFPNLNEFPYIANCLKSLGCRVSDSNLLFLTYRFLSKISPRLVSSTDDLNGLMMRFLFFDSRLNLDDKVKELSQSSRHDKKNAFLERVEKARKARKLVLLYVRTDFWDLCSGRADLARILRNRNSDISLYESSIATLISRGYFVVRIGRDSSVNSLSTENYVDYASSDYTCDEIDFFLWKHATFGITTGGGADEPSIIFKTPLLFLNFGEGFVSGLRGPVLEKTRGFLPKVFLDSDSGKILDMNELQARGFFQSQKQLNDEDLSRKRVVVQDNTDSTLNLCVLDFINSVEGHADDSFQYLGLRKISRRWPNFQV
jgi:putative glycosyltransferase (TIGR04372 family)